MTTVKEFLDKIDSLNWTSPPLGSNCYFIRVTAVNTVATLTNSYSFDVSEVLDRAIYDELYFRIASLNQSQVHKDAMGNTLKVAGL